MKRRDFLRSTAVVLAASAIRADEPEPPYMPKTELTITLIQQIAEAKLPPNYKDKLDTQDGYGKLFDDLRSHQVRTCGQFESMLDRNLKWALAKDAEVVKEINEFAARHGKRSVVRNTFYCHIGLVRLCAIKDGRSNLAGLR